MQLKKAYVTNNDALGLMVMKAQKLDSLTYRNSILRYVKETNQAKKSHRQDFVESASQFTMLVEQTMLGVRAYIQDCDLGTVLQEGPAAASLATTVDCRTSYFAPA